MVDKLILVLYNYVTAHVTVNIISKVQNNAYFPSHNT
jgi:hypothetical protein